MKIQHFKKQYIPDEYREKCDFQSWEGVKVVPGLAEGRGVFAEGALFATTVA